MFRIDTGCTGGVQRIDLPMKIKCGVPDRSAIVAPHVPLPEKVSQQALVQTFQFIRKGTFEKSSFGEVAAP